MGNEKGLLMEFQIEETEKNLNKLKKLKEKANTSKFELK